MVSEISLQNAVYQEEVTNDFKLLVEALRRTVAAAVIETANTAGGHRIVTTVSHDSVEQFVTRFIVKLIVKKKRNIQSRLGLASIAYGLYLYAEIRERENSYSPFFLCKSVAAIECILPEPEPTVGDGYTVVTVEHPQIKFVVLLDKDIQLHVRALMENHAATKKMADKLHLQHIAA